MLPCGELKAVTRGGKIIGFYTLRDDDVYEVAWVDEWQTIRTTSLDTLAEVKALLNEEYENRKFLYEENALPVVK